MTVPVAVAVLVTMTVSVAMTVPMTKGRSCWVLVRQVNQMANAVKDRVANPDQA